jgi:electron transfer flavoprotein alpha subunit
MTRPLSLAVIIKQVPLAEDFRLGPDGRLVREHVPLEVNPYCRRAIARGVELAAGGRCVTFTLGPPAAEDALREAVAAGATEGVHLCDPAFAGSDTLATARALAAAIRAAPPFDLILAGLNSVDADTGQVAPELAELLGLPFASGVRHLEIEGTAARVTCERDDGIAELLVPLPAVLSVAERLCAPAKRGPQERAAVPAERIRRVRAADLGPGPWGAAGSPTTVGEVRAHEHRREGRVLTGPLAAQVLEAVGLLAARRALPWLAGPADGPGTADGPETTDNRPGIADSLGMADDRPGTADSLGMADDRPGTADSLGMADDRPGTAGRPIRQADGAPVTLAGSSAPPPAGGPPSGRPAVVAVLEPGRPALAAELLGAAARLAAQAGAVVVAVCAKPADPAELGARGADRALMLSSVTGAPVAEEDVAALVAARAGELAAWAILAPGTSFGRQVAARIAARLGAGLTGDAIDLTVARGRMIAWKPAFAGRLVAAISARSAVQMATLRPGAFAPLAGGRRTGAAVSAAVVEPAAAVREITRTRDAGTAPLVRADCVLAVGAGVPPERYGELSRLQEVLGAELVGTRKVTDQGWLPRNRQVGLTGHSLSPRLYLTLGVSGKFNHLVGVRRAGTVLAVNHDPQAPVFDGADIGIVGDWLDTARLLTEALARELARAEPDAASRA